MRICQPTAFPIPEYHYTDQDDSRNEEAPEKYSQKLQATCRGIAIIGIFDHFLL